jgi:hypothetical protein
VKAALPEPAYPVRGGGIAPPQAPTSAPTGSACSKAQVRNPGVYGISALVPVQGQSIKSCRPELLPTARAVRAPDRDRGPRSRTARLHFLPAKLHFLSAKLNVP